MEFFLVVGFLLVVFPPYLYFKKTGGMNEKAYLTLLSIGAILIEIGLNMVPESDKGMAVYSLMVATLLLLILAGMDAMKAYSGKLTKYDKQRIMQIKQAEEVKKVMEEKNQHFKM